MDKIDSHQWSAQKAMVWTWFVVEAFWAACRFVIEIWHPVELGWGPFVIAMELIYITILTVVLFAIASYPENGIKGSTAIVAGTLLGLIWPLYWVFSGESSSWLPFFQLTTPGALLGLVYSLFRKIRPSAGSTRC